MAYYADGSWGNNQYSPFGAGSNGGFSGPLPKGTFNSPFSPGGGSDYYDSSGTNGNVGLEQYIGATQGGNSNNSNFANWLRSHNSQLYTQYGAANGQDPSLKWTDWLSNHSGDLQGQYQAQNPYQKNEQGQKKLQWL
jgi:hypothetical protein